MGTRTSIAVLVVAVAGLGLAFVPKKTEAAAKHVLGDNIGWTVPPQLSYYSAWASKRSFVIGDILVFNYEVGRHNLVEVTRENYEACNATEPIRFGTSRHIIYSLDSPGDHYFICAFPSTCSREQKLAIHVLTPLPLPSHSIAHRASLPLQADARSPDNTVGYSQSVKRKNWI